MPADVGGQSAARATGETEQLLSFSFLTFALQVTELRASCKSSTSEPNPFPAASIFRADQGSSRSARNWSLDLTIKLRTSPVELQAWSTDATHHLHHNPPPATRRIGVKLCFQTTNVETEGEKSGALPLPSLTLDCTAGSADLTAGTH